MSDLEGNETAPIPETLLAFAKDHRYIRQCQSLLQDIVGNRHPQQSDSDCWWLAALLYASLVVARTGRTLGMEFCGLYHSATPTPSLSRRQTIGAKAILLTGWAIFLHRFWNQLKLSNESVGDERHNARRETLRGSARRQFYEQQREAMLRRTSRATLSPSETSPDQSRPSLTDALRLPARMRQMTTRLVQTLAQAVEESSEGPHSLPTTNQGIAISLGKWILRLHLAQYCLTGQFPTWFHRLLRLNTKSHNQPPILSQLPSTYPLVGRLILLQAFGGIVKSMAYRWISLCMPLQSPTAALHLPSTPPPPLLSSPSQPPTGVCGICRMPRSHSAVSSSCGHVFCWNCLYQWVSTIRPECPLCRTSCQAQDILALYQYAP